MLFWQKVSCKLKRRIKKLKKTEGKHIFLYHIKYIILIHLLHLKKCVLFGNSMLKIYFRTEGFLMNSD